MTRDTAVVKQKEGRRAIKEEVFYKKPFKKKTSMCYTEKQNKSGLSSRNVMDLVIAKFGVS